MTYRLGRLLRKLAHLLREVTGLHYSCTHWSQTLLVVLLAVTSALPALAYDDSATPPSTSSILVSTPSYSREDGTVTIRWTGGFPPFYVRHTSDLSLPWIEHTRPLATNEFTMSTDDSHPIFFQIRTEFAPMQITAVNYIPDAGYLFLQWDGGTPPFQIQSRDPETGQWETLPEVMIQRHYEGAAPNWGRLFRVMTLADTTAPQPPVALSLQASRCDRVLLSWPKATDGIDGSGVISHQVYRDETLVGEFSGDTTLYLDQGLSPNTTYLYQVAAIDLLGNESTRSPSIAVTTPDCSLTETNLHYENCQLTVRWDRSEEPWVSGYIVYWGNEPGLYPWQLDVMQSETVTISDLAPGSAYFITVTAYSVDGIESEPSPELLFIVPSVTETSYAAKAQIPNQPDSPAEGQQQP